MRQGRYGFFTGACSLLQLQYARIAALGSPSRIFAPSNSLQTFGTFCLRRFFVFFVATSASLLLAPIIALGIQAVKHRRDARLEQPPERRELDRVLGGSHEVSSPDRVGNLLHASASHVEPAQSLSYAADADERVQRHATMFADSLSDHKPTVVH